MARRKTTEEFVRDAREIHGDRYDYSRVEYKNNCSKVEIGCRVHGPFRQKTNRHLQGRGCPACGIVKVAQARSSNTEEFIKKAEAVHGAGTYGYSRVAYMGANSKVEIVCGVHGAFCQNASTHLMGSGCPDCGGNKRKDTAQFIRDARGVHGGRYDYSQVAYRGNESKVEIVCKVHGPFKQTPANHLQGQGCPDCAKIERGCALASNTEKFIESAKAVHGDHYDYSRVEYKNAHSKVEIVCSAHGPFWQKPNNHLQGQGCPHCTNQEHPKNAERAWLYYLRVETPDGRILYKIGITMKSTKRRWKRENGAVLTRIMEWEETPGEKAWIKEQAILARHKQSRYQGPPVLEEGGNSELFTRDVMGLDKKSFARAFPPKKVGKKAA